MKKSLNRKVDVTHHRFGPEQLIHTLEEIKDKDAYLPKPVLCEDIDEAFVDFIKNDINLSVDGEKVPVFFLTIEKWTEFIRTWQSSDELKDVKLPFITIVRDPDIQPGANQDEIWNVPGIPKFTLVKVPTFINGRVGVDLYKIPQPTAVDMNYSVRFFSNKIRQLNKIHSIIQRMFNAHQKYVPIKGHPMPILLEAVSDESKIDDIEARRYYVQHFNMVVNGYILDEEDFVVEPMKDRLMVFTEGGETSPIKEPSINKSVNIHTKEINYEFLFKYNSKNNISFKVNDAIDFLSIGNQFNLNETKFIVNSKGNPTKYDLPFSVKRGDEIFIDISRLELNKVANFSLNGILNI